MQKFIKGILRWAATAKVIAFPRRYVGKAMFYIITPVISAKNGVIKFYSDPEDAEILDLIRRIREETELSLGDDEAHQIYTTVKRTKKIEGDIAEVGVYKGGSAAVICEAKENKALHLFDTFQGLPGLSGFDDRSRLSFAQYSASFESVKSYLGRYAGVNFYVGLFPATAEPVKNKKFSFVHLDVDLYESTLNCLKFFYPRMTRGGVILSHDYSTLKGVKKAFDEFFEDKPEIIIEPAGCQCMIVKL